MHLLNQAFSVKWDKSNSCPTHTSVRSRIWRTQADPTPGVASPAPLSLYLSLPAFVPFIPLPFQCSCHLLLLCLSSLRGFLDGPVFIHRSIQTGPKVAGTT